VADIKSRISSCIHEYFSYSEQQQLIKNINERWKQFFINNICETQSEEDCHLKFLNDVLHDLKTTPQLFMKQKGTCCDKIKKAREYIYKHIPEPHL